MKKSILSALLAAAIIFSATACNSASSSTAPASSTAGSSTAGSVAAPAETNWPKDTVTVVVPYAAGGDTDTYARQMCLLLQKELGANFIVVNTTGGGGVVASSAVKESKNDGYTALFHHTGVMLTQEASESVEFSFLKDFDIVGTVAQDNTYALIAKANSQWSTLTDMVEWAKANPGKLKYSVTYFGATHAVATLMQKAMGIEMNLIDVGSSTADRLTAFMADQCDVLVVNYMNIADYVEKGDFVVLGICAEERQAGIEDVPTLREQGYDVVQSKIYEVRLPKGTDPAIAEKFSAAIKKVCESEEYKNTLATYYAAPYYRDAATTLAEDTTEVERLKEYFAQ